MRVQRKTLEKGMTHLPGKMGPDDVRFHYAAQKAYNSNLMNCSFPEFSTECFRIMVDHR